MVIAAARERVGKTYRIQILDEGVSCLYCLPTLSKNGGSGVSRIKRVRNKNVVRPLPERVADGAVKHEIPKNSFVMIVDFHEMYGANWFEVEWGGGRYMVTESQVVDYFIPIHVRPPPGRNGR